MHDIQGGAEILDEGGGACGLCSRSRARREHAPRFPRFILIGSFSDTLLVVSILDMAYDCHL